MKKYSLNNSYFKNRKPEMPGTPIEIVKYFKDNNDLPFEYGGENWVYDMFNEYQKRAGIQFEQYLTPDKTAKYMTELLSQYNGVSHSSVLEIGCGTGQITKCLSNYHRIVAIDKDPTMIDICKILYTPNEVIEFLNIDFKLLEYVQFDYIICNPPYSDIPELLIKIYDSLVDNGLAVVLLPYGTFMKERPKKLLDIISKFKIEKQFRMNENFARTAVSGEISILTKL